jgi:hypothetical protein
LRIVCTPTIYGGVGGELFGAALAAVDVVAMTELGALVAPVLVLG